MTMKGQIQTPYYVVHKDLLDEQLDSLQAALDRHWPNAVVGYSYKTNALPWVIAYCDQKGCYAEVVSEDEYRLAQYIGVNKDRIVYNGPIKTKETFLEALKNGCYVNIDSQRELDWLQELPANGDYKLGLRVNFDLESCLPGHAACPTEGGRFGFCYENGTLEQAINRVRSFGLEVSGLHLHTSTKTRALEVYKVLAQKACEIAERFDLRLSFVDIGGGFFGGMPNRPQFEDYISHISTILATVFSKKDTTLIVEPGMSVIGPSISYVSSVIDVKDTTYGRFVVTDGSRTSIDPLMTKTGYFHNIHRTDADREILPRQSICGFTCMEHDRLFELKAAEALMPGDRITVEKVGAYTMCLTPLFIKYFPDVYLKDGDSLRLIRRRWQPQEYCGNALWGDMMP